MFKGLGNIAGLMKQASELQGKLGAIQEQLAEMRVEGTAGGQVTVTANGQQKVVSIGIDPQLLADGDREMLEDLLVAAVNQALDKARQLSAEQLANEVSLPGLNQALERFGMGGGAPTTEPSS